MDGEHAPSVSSQALEPMACSMTKDFDRVARIAWIALDGGFDALSVGEKLAAALVLNRSDWLCALGYTITEAIERLDEGWVALIPLVARSLASSRDHDGTSPPA